MKKIIISKNMEEIEMISMLKKYMKPSKKVSYDSYFMGQTEQKEERRAQNIEQKLLLKSLRDSVSC